MSTQVVICGSIAIDRIMNFSGRYRELIKPDKLHALSLTTLLDKLELSRGGTGANIAVNLARLGEKSVLIGAAGQDAKDYMSDLGKLGIDVSHVYYSHLPTASFNVITDSEDSQVGGFYQGAMSDSGSVSFMPWKGQDVLAVISPNNPEAMNRQVAECRQAGLRYIFDPGQQTTDPGTDLQAGVAGAEALFVNDYELGLLCDRLGKTADQLKKQLPLLITTLGRAGSLIEGRNAPQPIKVGVAKPSQVADPTGAGDAYRAGFLYGYLRQWDLKKCAQLGAATASFVIEQHGTQVEFTTSQVAARYKETFNEEIEL